MLFFIFPLSLLVAVAKDWWSSQTLAFCAQGRTVASRIINDADLKMYAEQTAYFLSVYLSAGSRAAHQNAGICVHKHSLDFLAARWGIWSWGGGTHDRRLVAPLILKSVLELQDVRGNMARMCLYQNLSHMMMSFCLCLNFLSLWQLTFKKWTFLRLLVPHKPDDQGGISLCVQVLPVCVFECMRSPLSVVGERVRGPSRRARVTRLCQ